MSELIRRHLDAIAASIQITLAHIEAARHANVIATPAPPPALPASCASTPEDQCGRRDEGARRPVMGGGAICTGCGERFDGPRET